MIPQQLKELLEDYDKPIKVIDSCFAWASLEPFGKQSVRFKVEGHGRKAYARAYPDPEKLAYQNELVKHFLLSLRDFKFGEKLRLTAIYAFPFLANDPKYVLLRGWYLMNTKPDLDNACKPVMDAIEEIIKKNDSRIVDKRERKIRFSFPFVAIKLDNVEENFVAIDG